MFSSDLISIIVGLSLLYFGICTAFMGFNMKRDFDNTIPNITIIIGIIAIIFGFLFLFYINALSFITGIQFYIVGFIMIVFGITGLISKMNRISAFTSILVLIMGIVAIALAIFIVAIALAIFALNQPIYIAIIIGVVLIIEGITMILD